MMIYGGKETSLIFHILYCDAGLRVNVYLSFISTNIFLAYFLPWRFEKGISPWNLLKVLSRNLGRDLSLEDSPGRLGVFD